MEKPSKFQPWMLTELCFYRTFPVPVSKGNILMYLKLMGWGSSICQLISGSIFWRWWGFLLLLRSRICSVLYLKYIFVTQGKYALKLIYNKTKRNIVVTASTRGFHGKKKKASLHQWKSTLGEPGCSCPGTNSFGSLSPNDSLQDSKIGTDV